MKTAISIPDDVYEAADELAEELGLSRSELYARAVAEYVARKRDVEITRKLNEVYSRFEGALEPELEELQHSSLSDEKW
jgi:metal-responsive CopG/Arc/MetJ family transcriptional regulator